MKNCYLDKLRAPACRFGSKADVTLTDHDVCFTPRADIKCRRSALTFAEIRQCFEYDNGANWRYIWRYLGFSHHANYRE